MVHYFAIMLGALALALMAQTNPADQEPVSAPFSGDSSAVPADTLFITEEGDTIHQSELDSLQLALAVVKVPELVKFVKATYPVEGLKKGMEGEVLFDLFLSDSGRVRFRPCRDRACA